MPVNILKEFLDSQKVKYIRITHSPAYQVDFQLLKTVAGANKVELASEGEFRDRFPECELGAIRLLVADFKRLEKPTVAKFSTR